MDKKITEKPMDRVECDASINPLGVFGSLDDLCIGLASKTPSKNIKFNLLSAKFQVDDDYFSLANLNDAIKAVTTLKSDRYGIYCINISCSNKFKSRLRAMAVEGAIAAGYDTSYPSGWTPRSDSTYEYRNNRISFIGGGERNVICVDVAYTDTKIKTITSWITHMESTGVITEEDAEKLKAAAETLR